MEPIDAPCEYCGAEPMEPCNHDCLSRVDLDWADENGDLI